MIASEANGVQWEKERREEKESVCKMFDLLDEHSVRARAHKFAHSYTHTYVTRTRTLANSAI